MNIDYELKNIESTIDRLTKSKAFLEEHREFLESLGDVSAFWSGLEYNFSGRDLDNDERLAIIKHFGGKWDKTYREEKVDYSLPQSDVRPALCVWGGSPPPSCRIVEEWVDVPATKVLKRKVVCQGDEAPPDGEQIK